MSVRALVSVSGLLFPDDEDGGEDVDVIAYDRDGHVFLALSDGETDEDGALGVDDLMVLTPRCAEALARSILGAAALAYGATPRESGDA